MDRITVTPETQQACEKFKATHKGLDPDGNIYTGSNLVVDDHLEIDNSWSGIVLGGEGGLVWFCVPNWGNPIMPIDLIKYITGRAGPDGQTMPIFDPPEEPPAEEPPAEEPPTEEPPHVEHHDVGGEGGST
jgi:hypothetical protein